MRRRIIFTMTKRKFTTTKRFFENSNQILDQVSKLIDLEEYHEALNLIKKSKETYLLSLKNLHQLLVGFYTNHNIISFFQVYEILTLNSIDFELPKNFSYEDIIIRCIEEEFKKGVLKFLPKVYNLHLKETNLLKILEFLTKEKEHQIVIDWIENIEKESSISPKKLEILIKNLALLQYGEDYFAYLKKYSGRLDPKSLELSYSLFMIYRDKIYFACINVLKNPHRIKKMSLLKYLENEVDLFGYPKDIIDFKINEICVTTLIEHFMHSNSIYLDNLLINLAKEKELVSEKILREVFLNYSEKNKLHKFKNIFQDYKINDVVFEVKKDIFDTQNIITKFLEQDHLDMEKYLILIQSYLKHNKHKDAEEILVNLKLSNIKISVEIYIEMINYYIQSEMIDSALEKYEEMSKYKVIPTIEIFISFLNYFIINDQSQKVKWVYDEMKLLNIKPNINFFNNVLEVTIDEKKPKILNTIKNLNLEFNEKTYEIMIEFFKKEDKIKSIINIDKLMRAKKIPKTNPVLLNLIQIYSKHFRQKEISFLLRDINDNDVPISYDITLLFIQNLIWNEDFIKLEKILWKMAENKIPPNPKIFEYLEERYKELNFTDEILERILVLKKKIENLELI